MVGVVFGVAARLGGVTGRAGWATCGAPLVCVTSRFAVAAWSKLLPMLRLGASCAGGLETEMSRVGALLFALGSGLVLALPLLLVAPLAWLEWVAFAWALPFGSRAGVL